MYSFSARHGHCHILDNVTYYVKSLITSTSTGKSHFHENGCAHVMLKGIDIMPRISSFIYLLYIFVRAILQEQECISFFKLPTLILWGEDCLGYIHVHVKKILYRKPIHVRVDLITAQINSEILWNAFHCRKGYSWNQILGTVSQDLIPFTSYNNG